MTTLLGFATIILIILIVFQLGKTSEMLKALRGEAAGQVSDSANRTQAILLMTFVTLFIIASVAGYYWYRPHSLILNWTASAHGHRIDTMFLWTSIICGIVFYITQALLFYFAYKYRARKGHEAQHFAHDNRLEVIWTTIPAIALTVLVAMGLDSWYEITSDPPSDAMQVEVTGEQFLWTVRYPGADSTFGERNYRLTTKENVLGQDWTDEANKDDILPSEIHLVVNKPVLFKLHAKDVLHSFYLPHFRVKMDCVPGIPTRFWMKPTMTTQQVRDSLHNPKFNFELACAELCGSGHSGMKFTVIVETQEEYDAWMAQQTPFYQVLGLDKKNEEPQPQADSTHEMDEDNADNQMEEPNGENTEDVDLNGAPTENEGEI